MSRAKTRALSDPQFTFAQVVAMREQVDEATQMLSKALRKGQVEVIRQALERGADIDAFGRSPTGKRRTTALNEAIRKNRPLVFELLLEYQAHPAQADGTKHAPIHVAARENCVWATERLLAAGVNPNAAGRHGLTPLAIALQVGADDVVDTLLAHPDILLTPDADADGRSHYICQAHTGRAVRALLRTGAFMTEGLQTNRGIQRDTHSAIGLLLQRAGNRASAILHTHNTWFEGIPEKGAEDPAAALKAFLEGGAVYTEDDVRQAALRGLGECLKVFDAQGVNMHALLPVLRQQRPALGSEWEARLSERALRSTLEGGQGPVATRRTRL